MIKSNLHRGYETLLAAKSFALLDPDTKGATNADGTKTTDEELAELKGVSLFNLEGFSNRESIKQREDLTDMNIQNYEANSADSVVARGFSNFTDINNRDSERG